MEQAKGNDMNYEDREACLQWFESDKVNDKGMLVDLVLSAWQAACEWRDSQVGEAVGWIQFADGKQTQNFCRDKEEIQTIDSLSRLMNKNSDISYQPVFLFSHDSVSAEKAWERGYKSGVEDERMSEANIGIAGLGGKINPARENPYRNGTTPPTAQINEQMREALQMFLDFHVNQAGITPEIIADKDNFDAFLANIEKRETQMVEKAKTALAATPK